MLKSTKLSLIVYVLLFGFSFVACSAPETVEVTRVLEESVEVTRVVEIPVEKTRIVEITIEVTRVVEIPAEASPAINESDQPTIPPTDEILNYINAGQMLCNESLDREFCEEGISLPGNYQLHIISGTLNLIPPQNVIEPSLSTVEVQDIVDALMESCQEFPDSCSHGVSSTGNFAVVFDSSLGSVSGLQRDTDFDDEDQFTFTASKEFIDQNGNSVGIFEVFSDTENERINDFVNNCGENNPLSVTGIALQVIIIPRDNLSDQLLYHDNLNPNQQLLYCGIPVKIYVNGTISGNVNVRPYSRQ